MVELFEHGTVKRLKVQRFKTANIVVELFEHGTVKGSRFKTANVVVELFEHGTKTLSAAYSFAPSVT